VIGSQELYPLSHFNMQLNPPLCIPIVRNRQKCNIVQFSPRAQTLRVAMQSVAEFSYSLGSAR